MINRGNFCVFQRRAEGGASSGDETITEGSDSDDEESGVVRASQHPIPTIEIEEICVGGDDTAVDDASISGSHSGAGGRASSASGDAAEPAPAGGIEAEEEASYDQTVPSDSPLESTEQDSSILEDGPEVRLLLRLPQK